MALQTGLVHGGNQQLKVYSVDDTMRDKDLAQRPISTTITKSGNPDDTLFRYPSKVFEQGSERATGEATTLANKRIEDRVMLAGRLHHLEESVEVGMVSNGNKTYGRDGLTEYEAQRKDLLEEHLKVWERVLSGNGESQAGNGSGAAYKTRGLGMFITPSSVALTDTDCPITDTHRTPAASCVRLHINALTETEVTNRMTVATLNGILGSMFDVVHGQVDRDVVCTRQFKSMVSSFLNLDKVADGLTKVSKYNGDIEDKRLGFVVEIYVADTGTLTFRMSTFLPVADVGNTVDSTEALILDWDQLWSPVRNAPGFYPVDNVALSKKTAVAFTQGLACVPRYHGKVTRAYALPA